MKKFYWYNFLAVVSVTLVYGITFYFTKDATLSVLTACFSIALLVFSYAMSIIELSNILSVVFIATPLMFLVVDSVMVSPSATLMAVIMATLVMTIGVLGLAQSVAVTKQRIKVFLALLAQGYADLAIFWAIRHFMA